MKQYSTSLNAPLLSSNTEIDWDGQSWKDRVFSHPERTIRIATAFSGIGSPEMALRQLGLKHDIVFACDIDKPAKKSYFANYPITEDKWHNDIRTLDASIYKGQVDLFVAGVCCQPWSINGLQRGTGDKRGELMYDFFRVLCECQPKVWIFENVENIIKVADKDENNVPISRSWPRLLNEMNECFKAAGLQYDLHWHVLDASDYGAPQHRERMFLVGFLKEEPNFKFPAPIKLEKCVKDYLDDLTPGIRPLTGHESIRLMGFEDFKEVVSETQLIKQAGNSIVVSVMKALYKQIDITRFGVKA